MRWYNWKIWRIAYSPKNQGGKIVDHTGVWFYCFLGFFIRWPLLRLFMSPGKICEYSRHMDMTDYHDYPDSLGGTPDHMVALTCKRCGKEFMI